MNRRLFAILLVLAASAALGSAARAATIKDNQETGQDGFVYTFNAVTFPLSTSYNVVPVGSTFTGHDTKSLVQFDTTLLSPSFSAASVTSATVSLHIGDTVATSFGNNPTASHAITIDAYPLLASWDRTTLTNSLLPAAGSLITSVVVSDYSHLAADPGGVTNYSVTLDLTNTVKGWLSNPATNFGVLLVAHSVVADNPPSAGPYYFAAIDSGFGSTSQFAPTLTVVPEPSTIALALGGVGLLSLRFLRRRGAGRSGSPC